MVKVQLFRADLYCVTKMQRHGSIPFLSEVCPSSSSAGHSSLATFRKAAPVPCLHTCKPRTEGQGHGQAAAKAARPPWHWRLWWAWFTHSGANRVTTQWDSCLPQCWTPLPGGGGASSPQCRQGDDPCNSGGAWPCSYSLNQLMSAYDGGRCIRAVDLG